MWLIAPDNHLVAKHDYNSFNVVYYHVKSVTGNEVSA